MNVSKLLDKINVQITLFVLLILFALFAYTQERSSQKNAYKEGIPENNDTEKQIYQKIKCCITTDLKTIKWRRSFLCALISTITIFLLVHFRVPTFRETMLYILIIYVYYYGSWKNYNEVISKKVVKHGKKNIRNLKRIRSLTLPKAWPN